MQRNNFFRSLSIITLLVFISACNGQLNEYVAALGVLARSLTTTRLDVDAESPEVSGFILTEGDEIISQEVSVAKFYLSYKNELKNARYHFNIPIGEGLTIDVQELLVRSFFEIQGMTVFKESNCPEGQGTSLPIEDIYFGIDECSVDTCVAKLDPDTLTDNPVGHRIVLNVPWAQVTDHIMSTLNKTDVKPGTKNFSFRPNIVTHNDTDGVNLDPSIVIDVKQNTCINISLNLEKDK